MRWRTGIVETIRDHIMDFDEVEVAGGGGRGVEAKWTATGVAVFDREWYDIRLRMDILY